LFFGFIGGQRHWTAYHDAILDDKDFEDIAKSSSSEMRIGDLCKL